MNVILNPRFVVMLLAVWLGVAPGSRAHFEPSPTLTITPVPTSVTQSRAGATDYASYTVTVRNRDDDRLGYLVFSATTTVPDGGGAIAAFVSSDGLSVPCTASAGDATTANCTLPALPKRTGSVTFTLVYKSPTAGTGINLKGTLKYAESAHHQRRTVSAPASTTVLAPVPDSVITYVPAATGATFGTGLHIDPATGIASATAADPTVTTVVVPAGQATTARIQESVLLQSCAIFVTCYFSDITMPGTGFNHLTIYLTRDVSTIPTTGTGVNINNVVILYDHFDGQGSLPVPNCADDLTRPSAGKPCVKRRTVFAGPAPSPIVDVSTVPEIDRGDWRLEIWATDNGRYSW